MNEANDENDDYPNVNSCVNDKTVILSSLIVHALASK